MLNFAEKWKIKNGKNDHAKSHCAPIFQIRASRLSGVRRARALHATVPFLPELLAGETLDRRDQNAGHKSSSEALEHLHRYSLPGVLGTGSPAPLRHHRCDVQ